MADLLQAGQQWLADQLKAFASRSVVYRRGAESVVVQATVGRTLLKLADGYGGERHEWTDRDYLIPSADLVINQTPITPERGDRIEETVGNTKYVYEVMAYGGEPPWRYSDPFGNLLRIHVKLVAAETL